jgi:hypothetical protein
MVQTAVVFVDAGYLFSAGSDAVSGRVAKRRDVDLVDPGGLIDHLVESAVAIWDGEPLRLLRSYWYDGAIDGVPTPEQIAVGALPRVKLRLGRVSAGGQKGVDGLIILDLITLARNRVADVAIVLSGDEDLRESAVHAQTFGLTLIVAGFPPSPRQGQSQLLLREADHVVTISPEVVGRYLRVRARSIETLPGMDEAPSQEASTTVTTPDELDVKDAIEDLCKSVVGDPRFTSKEALVERFGETQRLGRRADKVLVARLAELTGVFPVERELLERCRERCIALGLQRYGEAALPA